MTALEAALEVSLAQLAALEAGDTDAYLSRLDAQERACAKAAAEALARANGSLDQLVEVNGRIVAALAAVQAASRERLAALERARLGSNAYLATTPSIPYAAREA